MNRSQRFSIRLLLDENWISPLNDISKAHMISRQALLRRYIHKAMIADLEEIKQGFDRLKRIEATKKELSQKVKAHKGIKTASINEPLEY
ncbi:MAG TPA: hypothetical protein PKD37_04900 [Oligoflexia bacterium]|nr:hypothetical protein [Oligoflexia bacterium]HMP27304.1 hypothetical protein [Oligoflexia bacterium]